MDAQLFQAWAAKDKGVRMGQKDIGKEWGDRGIGGKDKGVRIGGRVDGCKG